MRHVLVHRSIGYLVDVTLQELRRSSQIHKDGVTQKHWVRVDEILPKYWIKKKTQRRQLVCGIRDPTRYRRYGSDHNITANERGQTTEMSRSDLEGKQGAKTRRGQEVV
ncbi:hypothetical protein QAD02_022409 [Eretmocerus hayati]|uniref:Uncharacterized protein n=1 Tax=Eretmocerus hayati TaxID=131215 RepID=A0ACC2PT66_9HYME|nr:hypothetical protein QAD02_022409 [Eretmocerus hayati]